MIVQISGDACVVNEQIYIAVPFFDDICDSYKTITVGNVAL